MTLPSPAPSHALFLASSVWLPSAPSAASLPTDVKLRLYGLFKLLSTPSVAGGGGDNGPPNARPSFWQVEARSKWDAWAAAAKEYGATGEDGRAEARRAYVEIARSVGFEGTERDASQQAVAEAEDDVDLDHLSSDDERDRQAEKDARPTPGSASGSAPASKRKIGGGGVGGKSISRMRELSPDDEGQAGAPEAAMDPMALPPWSLVSNPTFLRAHLDAHPTALNAFSPTGQTLLHLAADADEPSSVSLLLELGADQSLRDRAPVDGEHADDEDEGMTAREMAEINGFDQVVALLA